MSRDPNPSWKERKGVTATLLVAVLGVWGYAGYTLVATLDEVDDDVGATVSESPPQRSPQSREDRLDFTYSGAFRDPFAPPATEPTPVEPVASPPSDSQRPRPPEPEPPRVRFLGIVNGTATVETASGTVHFVRRGDEVDGARVTAVSEAGLTLRKNGRAYNVPLQ